MAEVKITAARRALYDYFDENEEIELVRQWRCRR